MANGRRPRAPGGGAGRRRSGWLARAARWVAAGVVVVGLGAAVADSDPVGSFVAGVDVSGGDGGGSVGYLAPVSAKLAGSGVITASHHIRSDGSCSYGRWSDGSCRACPAGQVWRTGRGCVRAESSRSCSSGNKYFPEYRRCRRTICPHGRTTTGYCRSAPAPTTTRPPTTTAATTTTVRSTTTTIRPTTTTAATTTTTTTTTTTVPASCPFEQRPDGSCRACRELDEYHDGTTGCVKKISPAPGDPKCRVEGEVYYSGYSKCLPSSCDHGRTSSGECRPSPPAVPSGVVADGDSRGLYPTEPESPPVNGQIVVSWSAVPGATGYVVSYALDSSSLSWRERSVSGTSVTLGQSSGILLDNLYRIRVKAVNGTGGSGWSDTAFSFPTYTPVMRGDSVGVIPIDGYRPTASYGYVLCTNTAPVSAELNKLVASNPALTRDIWQKIITDGIEIWDTKVGYITVDVPEVRRCSEEDLDISDRDISISLVTLIPHNSDDFCSEGASGCAYYHHIDGQLGKVAIYIRNNKQLTPFSCSQLSRLVVHESGHAFGLGDHYSLVYSSIMFGLDFILNVCRPSEYDIGAMKAIYQSRPVSTATQSPEAGSTGTATNAHSTSTTTTTKSTTVFSTTSSTTAPTTTTTASSTPTTVAATATTANASSTTTTTLSSRLVTVWQIETRPSKFDTAHREVEFALTSGNTFTYAGRTYTISSIKTYNRAPRIQATPDLEDHELPGGTLIRFWPVDTPSSVQTIRLSDGNEMPSDHRWDVIWPSARYPIDLYRNTTWHIDLTIPSESGS